MEYNLEERSVDYITIKVENEKLDKLKNHEILEYYEKNKEIFMSKEYRDANTLLLDAKEYAKKSTVTEEEIKLLYEERKDLLVEPAQRFLHQIIVDSENMAKSIKKKVNFKNFTDIANKEADLMQMIST